MEGHMNTHLNTLLLVDDTPDNLLVLSDIFTDAGYRVLCAESGDMALGCAHQGPPDLVMMDVRMPGMDGFETCRRLKALDAMQDVPILFTSAHVTAAIWRDALGSGGADVLSKPFNHFEVLTRVALHLKLQYFQRVLTSTPSI